jgi:hypothetical protein
MQSLRYFITAIAVGLLVSGAFVFISQAQACAQCHNF